VWYNQFIPHERGRLRRHPCKSNLQDKLETCHCRDWKKTAFSVYSIATRIKFSTAFRSRRALNAEAPLSSTAIHVCPGILGGDEWNSGGYNPNLDLLVVPAVDHWCSMIKKDKEPPSVEKANAGGRAVLWRPLQWPLRTVIPFPRRAGRLTGFTAATGKERWRL